MMKGMEMRKAQLSFIIIVLLAASFCFAEKNSALEKALAKKKEKMKISLEIKEKIIPPAGADKEDYIFYLGFFGYDWENYKVKNEKVVTEFKNYFGETKYRVIWNWDIDGDGYDEYLGVEEYPGIHHGVKKGVLVDDTGKIELYIDTKKGVYTPEQMVLDLKRLGVGVNEVECYSIGYLQTPKDYGRGNTFLGTYSLDWIKEKEEQYHNPGSWYGIGSFFLQAIDKDLKVMWNEDFPDNKGNISYRFTDFISITYDAGNDRIIYELFQGAFALEQEYDRKREMVKAYRKAKKANKRYNPPSELNKEDIENAIKYEMLN